MEFRYQCSECGKQFSLTPDILLCPDCQLTQVANRPLRGILDVQIEGKVDKNWQIHDLLPVENTYFPSIPVGNTPLWKPKNLRRKLRFPNLYLKDDTANPTCSLKDRASFLVAAFANKHGLEKIVVASTGNAASSMAGIGASAGLQVIIFMPYKAPRAKMIQSLQYGAFIIPVDGTYDHAFELSIEYSKKFGGFNRNTAYNPLTIEGKKTVALEIVKQLVHVPDYVFVPVGDGVILSGVFKGFSDLVSLNLSAKMPTVVAVQAQRSSAIYRAYLSGNFSHPIPSQTLADSICVDVPRNGYHALKQLKTNHGICVCVSDDEILEAQKLMSETTGLFTEPAAAAALAGLISTKDRIPKNSSICLLITGSGLKDIDTAMKKVTLPSKAIKAIKDIG